MTSPRPSLQRGTLRRALGRLSALCGRRLDSARLRRELRPALREVLAFDAYCVHTADPTTLAATSAVGDGLSAAAARRLFEIEAEGRDIHPLSALARGPRTLGTAHEATGGQVARSQRMAEIFVPMGLGDELRAALLVDGQCWGYLHLFRDAKRPPFSAQEQAWVGQSTRRIARALRASALLGAAGEPGPAGPGVLLLEERGEPASADARAVRWLDELAHDDRHPVPPCVLDVAERARRGGLARCVARTRRGAWVALHGVWLPPRVAVVIDAPRPEALAPVLWMAHGLSPRERGVAALLARGLSNDEIAASLDLTIYTVKDHLKAIFAKLDVGGRAELAAKLGASTDGFLDRGVSSPKPPGRCW